MKDVLRQFKRRIEPQKKLRRASVRLLGIEDRPITRTTVETVVDASFSMVNDTVRRLFFGESTALTPDVVEQKYEQLAGEYIRTNYDRGDDRDVYWVDGQLQETTRRHHHRKMMDEYAQFLARIPFESCLEVGAGELTTLAEVARRLDPDLKYHGVDLSFARVYRGMDYFSGTELNLTAARADARTLPYPDDSFDVVFTAHCLEHIPFDFRKAIDEMMRVARRCVVLFEPSYELGGAIQKLRMRANGYVRGLGDYLSGIDADSARVIPPRLLDNASAFNRTAHYAIHLQDNGPRRVKTAPSFGCPRCQQRLHSVNHALRCRRCHRSYPVIEGIADLAFDAAYSVESTSGNACSQSSSDWNVSQSSGA